VSDFHALLRAAGPKGQVTDNATYQAVTHYARGISFDVIDTSFGATYHRACPTRPWVINPGPILVRNT